MEARAYVRAKHIVENAKSQDDVPNDPMVDMVWSIQQDIAREARDARARLKHGHS